jgi:hypothetical protein
MPAANGQITVTGRVGQSNGDDVGSALDASDDARTDAARTTADKDLFNLFSIAAGSTRGHPILATASRRRKATQGHKNGEATMNPLERILAERSQRGKSTQSKRSRAEARDAPNNGS